MIRFFENFSIQGLSDDSVIKLENGKIFRLRELKTKRIKVLPDDLVINKNKFDKDDTMVGKGFNITYKLLDNFYKKQPRKKIIDWNLNMRGFKKS